MAPIHASAVEIDGAGVLIRGPSGSGKSDLALRLIDHGALLVADDRTDVECRDGVLVARPPAPIAQLIEVRGLGVLRLPYRRCVVETRIVAVVDLLDDRTRAERMPEPTDCVIEGVRLPRIDLHPFEASAIAKLRMYLDTFNGTAELLE